MRSTAEVNAKLVAVAVEILTGRMDLIDGCRAIGELRWETEDPSSDLFRCFVGVASEVEHLPGAGDRDQWNPGALAQKDRERTEAAEFYRDAVRQACEDLIARLGVTS